MKLLTDDKDLQSIMNTYLQVLAVVYKPQQTPTYESFLREERCSLLFTGRGPGSDDGSRIPCGVP